NWLYTVAYHLALKTRAQQAKRRAQERQVEAMPEIAAGGTSPVGRAAAGPRRRAGALAEQVPRPGGALLSRRQDQRGSGPRARLANRHGKNSPVPGPGAAARAPEQARPDLGQRASDSHLGGPGERRGL